MLDLDDFDYALDEGLIARYPLGERDASRLMLVDRRTGALGHAMFRDLPGLLRRGDVLVLNDTRVFRARLRGRKTTGGAVEFLLVERAEGAEGEESSEEAAGRGAAGARGTAGARGAEGASEAAGARGSDWVREADESRCVDRGHGAGAGPGDELFCAGGISLWRCLVRPAKGLGPGRRVSFGAGIEAVVRSVSGGGFIIAEFSGLTDEALEEAGLVPIPPYMGREPEALDSERYQTVFARRTGAVAAPTAGLHFTPRLLGAMRERGVEVLYVTLHTGPATFLPIRGDDAGREGPGTEAYSVEPGVFDAVQRARKEGRRVIAVGTTTVRALESAARGPGGAPALSGKTGLFIRPGFEFRVIDGLITNFHLPRSTLLMLTSAFGGHGHVMAAYAEAVRRRYRFYSYGDAMFIS